MRSDSTSGISRYSLLIILAVFLRLVLLFNPGFEADVSFWKSWGLATYDKGAVEGLQITNNNYPTPFAYVLGAMVGIYSVFKDPHVFNEFWNNTNMLFLVVSKLFPVLADFGIAALFLWIGKHAKRLGFPQPSQTIFGLTFYECMSVAAVLNPVGIMDGAWWGQVDSLGLFLFMCAVLLALTRKSFWAGVVFMISMMTKLQNMIYGPVFFLLVWQLEGYPGLIRSAAGALGGFIGMNIEFFLTHNAQRVIASLTQNYDYFPWMSLKAFNLWWLVTGGRGMEVSDKLMVLGILNAKTVGLILFSSVYLIAVLQQFFSPLTRKQDQKQNGFLLRGGFFTSLILVNSAFFLFQTQSHDRYAYPLTIFLLLWLPFVLRHAQHNTKRIGEFFILYTIFSIAYFYNLHTALVVNYPANGLPLLSSLTGTWLTEITAVLLLVLFGVFVTASIRMSRVMLLSFLVGLGASLSLITLGNWPLLTHRPVRLTRFTPFISQQAYGGRQTDKSVQSSFGGPNGWNRLSVQYAFYRHGIGTHANSRHVYHINRLFKTFTTDYGIDTESGTKASAVFEIYGDDTLLFRSPVMKRFDMPGHASVSVAGVTNLTLVTTDAGNGNYDDHTDWLNPILIPNTP